MRVEFRDVEVKTIQRVPVVVIELSIEAATQLAGIHGALRPCETRELQSELCSQMDDERLSHTPLTFTVKLNNYAALQDDIATNKKHFTP